MPTAFATSRIYGSLSRTYSTLKEKGIRKYSQMFILINRSLTKRSINYILKRGLILKKISMKIMKELKI